MAEPKFNNRKPPQRTLERAPSREVGITSGVRDFVGYHGIEPHHFSEDALSYVGEHIALNSKEFRVGQLLGAESYNRIINVAPDLVTISSSAAETTIYNYQLGGGTLGTRGAVRLLLFNAYLNNSGSGSTLTLKISYGATTMYQGTSASLTSSSNARVLFLDAMFFANDATGTQGLLGFVSLSSNAGAPTTGAGPLANAGEVFPIAGNASEDSTKNKAITVTAQHSVNNALTIFSMNHAVLTKISH